MKRVSSLLLALALAGAVPGCKADELVELRLYPCEFAGIEPRAVTVEVTGFDRDDELVETFEVSFDDIAATTFADGYATVGYRKHGEVVRARFRVGWFESVTAGSIAQANAIAVYEELDVPDLGEVLVLGELAADCAALIAGDTDTDGSTGDTLDSSTGETLDTDSSSSDSDSSSSADTLDTLDTLDTSLTDTSTDSTDGDPPGPMVGDPCTVGFYCTGGPTPEDAGTPLLCNGAMMLESTDLFGFSCADSCLDGTATSIDGCGGIGYDAKCLCQSIAAPNCVGETLGCVSPDVLHLCFEGKVVVASCPNCDTLPEGWYTCD